MKTNNINIQEVDCELKTSRDLIFNFIDSQINSYKLQFLSEWERNHDKCSKTKNERIKALNAKKEELRSLFMECKSDNPLVDINITVDIAIKDKNGAAVLAV